MNINDISSEMLEFDRRALEICREPFERIEKVREHNQLKVLDAFIKNRVGAAHLGGSTGYGYGDIGRDSLDKIFADIVGAQDAICRPHFMSGTHALTVALFGVMRPNMVLLSLTGSPYDTLSGAIRGSDGFGSLAEFGVGFDTVALKNGMPDYAEIERRAPQGDVLYIQRSRGYGDRKALTVSEIGKIIECAHRTAPDRPVIVDNCYGEFTQIDEPIAVGADLIIGSLIKNAGGGIAQTGGYIAGRADLVEKCAHHLTAPGTGREIGCWPTGYRELYLGLYLAPMITAEALKSAVYASSVFTLLGYDASPAADEVRSDIVTTVKFGSPEKLTELCRAIQAASPVDSYAVPEAWDMPGYEDKVIMAAGAFTNGSSIELSCDAPLREPYIAYMQGGISFDAAHRAILLAADRIGVNK